MAGYILLCWTYVCYVMFIWWFVFYYMYCPVWQMSLSKVQSSIRASKQIKPLLSSSTSALTSWVCDRAGQRAAALYSTSDTMTQKDTGHMAHHSWNAYTHCCPLSQSYGWRRPQTRPGTLRVLAGCNNSNRSSPYELGLPFVEHVTVTVHRALVYCAVLSLTW